MPPGNKVIGTELPKRADYGNEQDYEQALQGYIEQTHNRMRRMDVKGKQLGQVL